MKIDRKHSGGGGGYFSCCDEQVELCKGPLSNSPKYMEVKSTSTKGYHKNIISSASLFLKQQKRICHNMLLL